MVNTEHSQYLFAADQSLDLNFSMYIYWTVTPISVLAFLFVIS